MTRQFHHNGFRAGDPFNSRNTTSTSSQSDLPEQADVLIVGCGPAGLLLAAQLAQMPDISTVIIDAKSGPLQLGQADGVSGRSIEIFQALNFSEKVLKEAYQLHAITFWSSADSNSHQIVRRYKKPDGRTAYSQFPHVVLNQARIHDFLLEAMASAPDQRHPYYDSRLVDLNVVNEPARACTHPVSALIETTRGSSTSTQSLHAKYVVGCDGARSRVRELMGLTLRGDAANKSWGVMDLLATTDFPDVRMKSIIQSRRHGNLMIIPREGDHLIRVYVELDTLDVDERISDKKIDVKTLIEITQGILKPYNFEVKEVVWWSVYEIGQRLADHFDNRHQSQASASHPRCFIAGDACHTHSPKAGQGMNVSMHDAFNLGWKLAAVIRGHMPPQLLRSYSDERHGIAQELIDFDRELANHFAGHEKPSDDAPSALQAALLRADGYVSGTLTEYQASTLIDGSCKNCETKSLIVGRRLPSAPVLRLSDARPMQLSELLPADGRWRIILFADPSPASASTSKAVALAQQLSEGNDSPILRLRAEGADVDSDIDCHIEVLCVFQNNYDEIDIGQLPAILRPLKGPLALRDYSKVFCPAPENQHLYETLQIDPKQGCVAVVRPDQHLAALYRLEEYQRLAGFFSKIHNYKRPSVAQNGLRTRQTAKEWSSKITHN